MSQVGETFFTAIGCMDGRVQQPIAKFGQERFGAKFPDTITEAGLVGKLSKENIDQAFLDSIKFKVIDVSLGKHHSKGIIVHGHQECAGNPVDDEKHRDDIRRSVSKLKSLIGEIVPVIGIFVKRDKDGLWKAEEIPSTVTV